MRNRIWRNRNGKRTRGRESNPREYWELQSWNFRNIRKEGRTLKADSLQERGLMGNHLYQKNEMSWEQGASNTVGWIWSTEHLFPGSPVNIGRCWARDLVLIATQHTPAKPLQFLQFGGSLFTVNFKILLCHFSHRIALLDIQMEMKRINPDKTKLTITTAKS